MAKTIAQQLNVTNFPFIIKNEQGKEIYFENSKGYWSKREYNEQGEVIYYENFDGYWSKREYNEQGKQIYFENFDGYWSKKEYNEQGKEIYYENSDGYIIDNRPKTVELTMDEIASKLGIDVNLLKIKK